MGLHPDRLAKGIVVIMQDAMIMDTVIYFLSNLLQAPPPLSPRS